VQPQDGVTVAEHPEALELRAESVGERWHSGAAGVSVRRMERIGITALVPPEVVYACGCSALDLNNLVPESRLVPGDKLCAWSAVWRELVLRREVEIDGLVVVAGGDCYTSLVDAQRIELAGVRAHHFIYPFSGDRRFMREQVEALAEFLGEPEEGVMDEVAELKAMAMQVHRMRARGEVGSEQGFRIEVSASDLMGSPERYREALAALEEAEVSWEHRIALLGVPPIYSDFHALLQEMGMQVVFDEMPYEFIRHTGRSMAEVARSYAGYTFALHIRRRLEFLRKQLRRHRVEAAVHFHQYACHHRLEDPLLRGLCEELGIPYLSVEADLPGRTPEQVRLRLEAFAERLSEGWA